VTRPPDGAPWPTAGTRPLGVLGWPVRHSLSPVIHNAALREQGLDLVYLAFPVPPDHLAEVVRVLGAVEAIGVNVTVPHKRAVVALCDHLTEEAELIGAVNTLAWTSEGLLGDNTDAVGLRDALTAEVPVAAGDELVVLGTGGAGRAAAVAAGRLGARCTIVGRRPDAAEDLAALAVRAGAPTAEAVELADDVEVAAQVDRARVVINATPLGMDGERLPSAFHQLHPGQVAYDLIYQPPDTPFLKAASAAGASAHHGLGMLVAQAAASYRRWTGREAPLATMSAAALRALSHPAPGA
jgi:shikimate dehydrogenase